jgi:hypothetical protein
MGFTGYFKAKKPEEKKQTSSGTVVTTSHTTHTTTIETSDANSVPLNPLDGLDLQVPTPHFGSSRNSVSGRSQTSSVFMDDIKHEVMVNYLYQQQCSHLWVSDGSGEVEGVLLRKVRGQYMACPPQLADSPFAAAATALNLPVCLNCFCRRRGQS